MTMILAILLLGAFVWAAIAFGGRISPSARVPLGAALMLGLAGYLLVGQPGVADAPQARPEPDGFGQALTDPRQGMTDRFGPAAQWLSLSDSLIRSRRTYEGSGVLANAIARYPGNIDLWVGYGNALVAHGGGMMTPAAAMAFDKAAAIDPSHPAPPFFAGLSLAQGGDIEGARVVWSELLRRSPANAPWRRDLTERLAQLPPAPPAPTTAGGTMPPATPAAATGASRP